MWDPEPLRILHEHLLAQASLTIRCSWILSTDAVPRSGARLLIEHGRLAGVVAQAHTIDVDLRPYCALPRLVNPHAHLEFSDCQVPFDPGANMTEWIRDLMQFRNATERDDCAAVYQGLSESERAGVAAVGEIVTSTQRLAPLLDAPLEVVAFRELIGLKAGDVRQAIQMAESFLSNPSDAAHLHPALSPHAPYSVHPELLAESVRLSQQYGVPLAMHLGETRDERELLDRGTGAFRQMLQKLGLWDPALFPAPNRMTEILHELQRAERALVIHGNYLTPNELRIIAESDRMSLVYCPRTHRHFGHGRHPWNELRACGGRVVLGTDGRGSNPDLGLFEEMKLVASQEPAVDLQSLLRMVSTDAAWALGLDGEWGTAASLGERGAVLIATSAEHADARQQVCSSTSCVAGVLSVNGAECRLLP